MTVIAEDARRRQDEVVDELAALSAALRPGARLPSEAQIMQRFGVSRAVAAVAENSHDDKGLIWPRELAPADVHVVIAGKGAEIVQAAEDLAEAGGEDE